MADSGALRDELRRLGHVGAVETFAGRVRVSRSGEVRVLEPDEQPGSPQDSVVLADPGPALMFPFDQTGQDIAMWKSFHERTPVEAGSPPPIHVYAHAHLHNGRLFANEQWRGGASFAAALVDAGISRHGPRTPLHLKVELYAESRRHVNVARKVARVLRGDGPYREVLVNTAPVQVDPQTGLVDVAAARFERVSELLITDIHWQELTDSGGRPHGAALLGDASLYRGLRKGARFADDHNTRLAVMAADVTKPYDLVHYSALPWASSIGAGRARPFVLHLESEGQHYLVQSKEGAIRRLSVREMARLLASPAFHLALTDPRVRRPLALITRTATPNSALNRELLDLLMKEVGVRAYFEYSGPVGSRQQVRDGEVTGAKAELILPRNARFTAGPASMWQGVRVRRDGDVFALAGDADLGPDLLGVARRVARGEFGDQPWGAQLPLVVAAHSVEGHAVVPTTDGGHVELEGQDAFHALSANEDFRQSSGPASGRPVVLVGEDAGTRVNPGGFGFDFASALHRAKDFRDVYAMTRDENGDPVFTPVSGLRSGDVAVEPLENAAGQVVAVVVRSTGDEVEVEHARRWARKATAETTGWFWNSTTQRFEYSPWPAGELPLLILVTRRGEQYLAARSDGANPVLSMDGLTAVLRDSLMLRNGAGVSPDVEFVFAALGGESVEPVGFGRGMLAGGYSRRVHWPAGHLMLLRNGRIAVEGDGFRTAERVEPGPDDIVAYPLLEAGTGRPKGVTYPEQASDLLMMQDLDRRESTSGFKHYIREVTTQAADGSAERRKEKAPMKWAKRPVRPWFVVVHGLPGSVAVRLRTGYPLELGDLLELSPRAAGQVFTRNRIYRSVPHPAGEEKVATICSGNQPPATGGDPLACYLVEAFTQVDGFPATVWAADQVVSMDRFDGRRSVLAGGSYRKVVLPGEQAADSSDDDFPDTDPEVDSQADSDSDTWSDSDGGVDVPFGKGAPEQAGAATGAHKPAVVPTAVQDVLPVGGPTATTTRIVALPADVATEARWRELHAGVPSSADGSRPILVFAHASDGSFRVDGGWGTGGQLAAEVDRDPRYRAADPTTPVLLVTDGAEPTEAHLRAAEEFAEALRGDGPYREVSVNTAPVGVDPFTGRTDLEGARFTRVSLVRATDLLWDPLTDAHGDEMGMAVIADEVTRSGLRDSAAMADDYAQRLVATATSGGRQLSAAPWADATEAARARPFVLRVEGQDGDYTVQLHDGRVLDLTVRDMRRMLLAHWFYQRLAGGPARRPLVLLAHSPEFGGTPNQELLAALQATEGARHCFEYSGPVVVERTSGLITLAEGGAFTRGPESTSADVVLTRFDDVFHFPARAATGLDLALVADAVVRGTSAERPWGDRDPLVVVVASTERYADVTPAVGEGVLQFDGVDTGVVALGDDGFRDRLRADRTRPVVLVGEDAGARVDIGGFGFDFASALHASHDFRDVYAMTRDEDGTPRFALVSDLRMGDLLLEPLTRADGAVVAVVVRSEGDEERVGQLRRWARNSSPQKVARVRLAAGDESDET
ncbi:hypothetical protein AB0G02_28225, partial [Actinosynnema sp. NPDC023658]|uniref:hypothetical protein n=1 Tax=Actinosynnema sp. NPDC023658 TaxID=3155465 RepID=UPI0033E9A18A